MKRIFFCIFIFPMLLHPVWAGPFGMFEEKKDTALVVQTFRVQPYEQAVDGFDLNFHGKIHNLCLCDASKSTILKRIEKRPPNVMLAVGLNALTGMMSVRDIPIIYLMVLEPPENILHANNIYGISMMAHPDDQLEIVQRAMPWVKNIGILYDSASSGVFVELALVSAQKRNIVLIDRATHNTKDFIKNLNDIHHQIDVLWMTPDIKLLSSENIEYLLLMTMEKKIPIITFSEKFVELGALMSIGVDASDMGRQAGKLATKILSETNRSSVKTVYPEKTVVTINTKISKKLNISIVLEDIENLRIVK